MDNRLQRKQVRKTSSRLGWALLIYMLIMNLAVTMVALVDSVVQGFLMAYNGLEMTDAFQDELQNVIVSNGWGYLLTIAFGLALLYLWKKKAFFTNTLWLRGKPMSVGAFFALLCFVFFGQAIFQIIATVLEYLFNLFGLSVMESINSASIKVTTLSMFLYVAIFGPIAEEILFRGLVLRSLQPYGKKFAIIASSFLFGIFHGNLVQGVFAFAVGLVFAYVAVEYNIVWAMLLHIINNMVLGDMLPRALSFLPSMAIEGIMNAVLWSMSIAAAVITVVKRREIAAYLRENTTPRGYMWAFFTALGVIVFILFMCANIALLFFL